MGGTGAAGFELWGDQATAGGGRWRRLYAAWHGVKEGAATTTGADDECCCEAADGAARTSSNASLAAAALWPHCPPQALSERIALAGAFLWQQHFLPGRQQAMRPIDGSGEVAASGEANSIAYSTSSMPATTRCPQRL